MRARSAVQRRFDWWDFWVHFVPGAVFGIVLGFNVWGRTDYAIDGTMGQGPAFIFIGAMLGGIAFGISKAIYRWDNFSKRGPCW
jgi:hypothetical protein